MATSDQPCSLHDTWLQSVGHILVIDEHDGCDGEQNGQLILKLINGSCSSPANHGAHVTVHSHPAESFDAFHSLNLKFYRGQGSIHDKGAGQGSASAQPGSQGPGGTPGPSKPSNVTQPAFALSRAALPDADISVDQSANVAGQPESWSGTAAERVMNKLHLAKHSPFDCGTSNATHTASSPVQQVTSVQHEQSSLSHNRHLLTGLRLIVLCNDVHHVYVVAELQCRARSMVCL